MNCRPRLAVIGAGAMGANHARVLVGSTRADLAVVIDTDRSRAAELANAAGVPSSTELASAMGCHGAVVASATDSHAAIARSLLEAGIPVLVEKPLAPALADVHAVLRTAEQRGVPVACGFVERFNAVVRTAEGLLHDQPLHLLAVRHSPPNGRATASVVQDLLVHDIDLACRLGGGAPVAVHGTGWAPPGHAVAELADATLRFDAGMVATLSASRVGQRKVRALTITTASAAVELDLLRQDITVYRHVDHEQLADGALTYRTETVIDIPFVRHAGEPLALQLDHFLDLLDGTADADEERRSILPPHAVAAAVEAPEPAPAVVQV